MRDHLALARARLAVALAQWPYLLRTLGMVWTAARPWTLAWIGLLILQGILPVATVYLTRALVDNLVLALESQAGWMAYGTVLPLAGGLVGVLLSTRLLAYGADFVRTAQAELVTDHVSALIHDQSMAVDLSFYERADYYDRLYRAQYHALERPLILLESLGAVLQNGLTLVAMAAVLLPYGVGLPVALVASSLPALYVLLEHRYRFHCWRLKNTENERRTWYYNWLLTDREPAAELRMFDLGPHFQSRFQTLRRQLRNERIRLAWDQGEAEAVAGTGSLLIMGGALAWMLWKVMQGLFSLGDLALFAQAFQQGQRLMGTLFESLGDIYSNSLFLSDLFSFLALKPTVADPEKPVAVPTPLRQGIRFDGVTFRYPGSARAALKNFHLEIPAGQIVAIVGANGAGKSTLIRLLCRFYDPDQGRILLDDVDLRCFRLQELRRQITVLFQEPIRYQDTARENIVLGDRLAVNGFPAVQAAARAAGADSFIAGLPRGYETLLGRWFKEGCELSGGEWQRLALARAYWRLAPILVLDEPTSAMDPWAEHDWLQRFRRLAAGRTVLMITHRFTTAMYADMIHVMEAGQVVESGSHDQLLAQGGRYARSWRQQMQGVSDLKPAGPGALDMVAGI
ncbi:MAG: HlyB/MsbA family ABC transporter [Litorilinea sp.]|nr:MAG: HlyB/MsbA family ABC transporter [Litorilinea sp.]